MKKFVIIMSLLGSAVSPALANNADNFQAHDPIGWMMAVISMGVVFVALLKLFHRKKQYEAISEKRSSRGGSTKMTVKDAAGAVVNDEDLAAAIGVALFLHEDGMHDAESDVLTLMPTASAWTGAGQNLKKSPIRKF